MWEPDDPDIVSSSPKRHQNSGAGAGRLVQDSVALTRALLSLFFPAQSSSKAW